MGNLINSIQHFFIATVTTVATVIMVALPFHKPPIHPTPSLKQEVQVKKEMTPSPTSQATQSASPSTMPIAIPSPTSALINCVGPDGKVIKLTQKACDAFNAAWNNPTSQSPSSSSTNNKGSSRNTYYYPNIYYPITNNSNSTSNNGSSTYQQAPTSTPQPVDNSQNLQICLSNAQNNYNNQMGQLNARGMASSGQADQVKSDYAAQQQACHQQYGN
jgi:hypothetical protein